MIAELKELGKPFLVVLNSAYPNSERARAIRADIAQRHQVACVSANCLELGEEDMVIPFSAEKGTGRDELLRAILSSVEASS